MATRKIIAIDGPVAAGKSTIAKRVAKELGLIYIDTGAMYRCLALYALQNGIDVYDENALEKAAKEINIVLTQDSKVFLNGKEVTKEIRSREVTNNASQVSYPRKVREIFVRKQQEMANNSENGVVMDGRDIGTVVLTNANLKIYQIASIEVRAQRRYLENIEKGINTPLDELIKEIEKRDYMDMNKGFGALKKAEDAIELDTSNMTIEEVVDFIVKKANEIK